MSTPCYTTLRWYQVQGHLLRPRSNTKVTVFEKMAREWGGHWCFTNTSCLVMLCFLSCITSCQSSLNFVFYISDKNCNMPSKFVEGTIFQFRNCTILWDHELIREDLWVRNGKILNPEKLFFEERAYADVQVDCEGSILAPGYIDVQINGKVMDLLNFLPNNIFFWLIQIESICR